MISNSQRITQNLPSGVRTVDPGWLPITKVFRISAVSTSKTKAVSGASMPLLSRLAMIPTTPSDVRTGLLNRVKLVKKNPLRVAVWLRSHAIGKKPDDWAPCRRQ